MFGFFNRPRVGADCLPTFVCLGAQKSGTTWLYEQLRQHPQVRMPAIKELQHFHPWHSDLAKYKEQFSPTRGHVSGDITPEYFVSPLAPEQMAREVPKARLFAILRNPVERAFSQFRMALYLGNMKPDLPFEYYFEHDKGWIRSRGLYLEQIERYRRFFPSPKQFRVFLYDDLLANPARFYRQICKYLGISRHTPASVRQHLDMPYAGDGRQISPQIHHLLANFYQEPNRELQRYLGRPLPW